jgi:hypothetical protein
VTYAVGALSGGGAQPVDALPAGAFAVVSVDLDPSAKQKVDGFRFLRKFPALRAHVPADGDVREVLFDAVAGEARWGGIDFDSQVAPWLGKRVAVAEYPAAAGAKAPTTVVALQVTDGDAARAGLQRLVDAAARPSVGGAGSAGSGGLGTPGFVVDGDYALLAETPAVAQAMADRAESAPLSGDSHFAADLAAAGDGIAVSWFDLARAGSAAAGVAGALGPAAGAFGSAAGTSARVTFVARFNGPDVFEVVGHATGVTAARWATHPVSGMGRLPRTSVVALGLSGGGTLVDQTFPAMRTSLLLQGADPDKMVDRVRRSLGVRLPGDLSVLLGDNLVAALDAGGKGHPQVGARVTTDVAKAQDVLDKLERGGHGVAGVAVPHVVRRVVGGDLVVASTAREAKRLARRGTLGDVPAFTRSLPDLAGADAALWVDPSGLASAVIGARATNANLEPIDGLGVTLSSGTKGAATYRLRLVAH